MSGYNSDDTWDDIIDDLMNDQFEALMAKTEPESLISSVSEVSASNVSLAPEAPAPDPRPRRRTSLRPLGRSVTSARSSRRFSVDINPDHRAIYVPELLGLIMRSEYNLIHDFDGEMENGGGVLTGWVFMVPRTYIPGPKFRLAQAPLEFASDHVWFHPRQYTDNALGDENRGDGERTFARSTNELLGMDRRNGLDERPWDFWNDDGEFEVMYGFITQDEWERTFRYMQQNANAFFGKTFPTKGMNRLHMYFKYNIFQNRLVDGTEVTYLPRFTAYSPRIIGWYDVTSEERAREMSRDVISPGDPTMIRLGRFGPEERIEKAMISNKDDDSYLCTPMSWILQRHIGRSFFFDFHVHYDMSMIDKHVQDEARVAIHTKVSPNAREFMHMWMKNHGMLLLKALQIEI